MDRWIDAGRCGSSHYSSLFITVVVQCLGSSQLMKVTVFHIVRDFCKAQGRFCKDVSLRRTVSQFLENVGNFCKKSVKHGGVSANVSYSGGSFRNFWKMRGLSRKMPGIVQGRFCKDVLLGRTVSQFLQKK